ncbi:polyphosphate kinase 1 [Subsaxibacter sp. CAU 1640]|uniref:polyphosphate kinase 1 n=1 Tax=Subsaxibacter sp. CAU 1640 TaxID=2933271 RepID=UPI0020034C32|nr:polyphosphate kinase 1 [Subsaxibacter sp. CAU 1640]MCK7590367.1 polyphosphate kinase 1 [Subsaxibacter sp. CAU 1640]
MASLYNNKYYHRDLSWLRFNHRVLQEMVDKRNPLYERIKFMAIFSSNLDEFFRVRVSDIRQIKVLDKPLRKKLITKPNAVLKELKVQVDKLQEEFGDIFENQIIPDLKQEGISLIKYKDFTKKQKKVAEAHFDKELKHKIDLKNSYFTSKDAVFVENESSYITASISKTKFQVVQIPKDEPRFFVFPSDDNTYAITFIDDIIKYNLYRIQSDLDLSYYAIKISRDAELYIEDEFSGNLMEKIKESLPKRETGQATRILIDKRMPQAFQNVLKKALDVSHADIVLGGTYHNFRDFFKFPNPTKKNLYFEELPPLSHPVTSNYDSMFEAIDEKDQLMHFPYQSFDPVIKLIEEAADDPSVKVIKMTMYRLADESRLNSAVARAAKKGKKVVVFIEVKARFDEHNNLKWGEIFKENGAEVLYSYPGIKVHSKVFYIEREIEGKTKTYCYIGTGNFNEKTAELYTDFGLMTAHKKITQEINKIFLVLEGIFIVPKAKKLLVSPFTMRYKFVSLVENEILAAQAGKEAYIIMKMNSLQDKNMIKLLYEASQKGVQIRLLVRGICSLVPGIKGQSENIYITSILDRFLEHGRIYIFGNGGEEKMYIGSADWMTRNLSHRIEVVTPILDPDHFKTIRDVIDIQLKDNVKARIIDAEQTNAYVKNDEPEIRSQYATYDYFKNIKQ